MFTARSGFSGSAFGNALAFSMTKSNALPNRSAHPAYGALNSITTVCGIAGVDRLDLRVSGGVVGAGRVHLGEPGEPDVFRRDGRAVVPHGVRVQVVRHRERVLGDPTVLDRGDLGDQRRGHVVPLEVQHGQAWQDVLPDRVEPPRERRARRDRVRARRPLFGADDDAAAGLSGTGRSGRLGRRPAAAVIATAAARYGNQHQRRHQDDGARSESDLAWTLLPPRKRG